MGGVQGAAGLGACEHCQVLSLHGSRGGFCEVIPHTPGAGAVEPLVKLVEAATDAQRRATDGSGFQVEVVQHLLTMQMQHPQLRSAIRQVSVSLGGAQMRKRRMACAHVCCTACSRF